jgi:hypothetical protein
MNEGFLEAKVCVVEVCVEKDFGAHAVESFSQGFGGYVEFSCDFGDVSWSVCSDAFHHFEV